jgi:hypothetical protein
MPVLARTAEWNCTRCGVTNRKLVPMNATQVADRCVACHAKHLVAPTTRPVRWDARAT